MSKADEPAFPTDEYRFDNYKDEFVGNLHSGLTKREYFAAMALQGIMANGDWTEREGAVIAVTCADLLLAALERKPE